jgi:sugar phosphate isomerase/epimerase
MNTRRDFLKSVTLGAAASAFPAFHSFGAAASGPTVYAVFTKHFIGLDYDQLADTLAGLGITAIEAPIRPKGGTHVEVDKIETELPKFVEALKKRGVQIITLTSGINEVSEKQHTEKVLRAAKAAGIPRFRMDWYKYDTTKPIWPQLGEFKPKLKDLIALTKDIGIQACYQNHSGKDLAGAPIWDIATLMRDYSPKDFAWCFDIMHTTIEGAMSWPIEVDLARDYIAVANFKNFAWDKAKVHHPVPLAEGVVTKAYVQQLKQMNWSGPVCLHVEYLEGKVTEKGNLEKAIEATKTDMETLKSWWA